MTSNKDKQQIDPHDDSMLMIPPPGFKFVPRYEVVCGKPGCFECFDIYCERCECKDRRIVELEMRNNDLIKYITQLQSRLFGGNPAEVGGQQTFNPTISQANRPSQPGVGTTTLHGTSSPFAYIQSPVLYDPNMNVSYIATTTFSPSSHEPAIGKQQQQPPKAPAK